MKIKKPLMLMLIGLLLVSSVTAFSWNIGIDSSIEPKSSLTYEKDIQRIAQQAKKYDGIRQNLGWKTACIKIGTEEYLINAAYEVLEGCPTKFFGVDAAVTVDPEIASFHDESQFLAAYHEGKIVPNLKTRLRVGYVCGIKRQCTM